MTCCWPNMSVWQRSLIFMWYMNGSSSASISPMIRLRTHY